MAKITLTTTDLTVELTGLRQLWALKRRITVPLSHMRGATVDAGVFHEPKGLRAPGLHVPGFLAIGSFRRAGEWTFWEVKDRRRTIVIELTDEHYARLVVEVDDPRAVVDSINAATVRR